MNDKATKQQGARITRMIGLGTDSDGHIRFTQGAGYELLQGSEKSHEQMQAWCEEINRRLAGQNKRMEELSVEEFLALARAAAPRP
jgi:hypothetical protein